MIDKKLNELLEYNQEYMDARLSEDLFSGDYTSEVELKYLKKDYDKLQSNWNSLREWLEERYKITKENSSSLISKYDGSPLTRDFYEAVINIQAERKDILDKMNELEGVDNENKDN